MSAVDPVFVPKATGNPSDDKTGKQGDEADKVDSIHPRTLEDR